MSHLVGVVLIAVTAGKFGFVLDGSGFVVVERMLQSPRGMGILTVSLRCPIVTKHCVLGQQMSG